MARIVKPKEEHHSLRMLSDRNEGELLVVGHSKRNTYVWVGPSEGAAVCTFSGTVALRKLAKHILEIVGEE